MTSTTQLLPVTSTFAPAFAAYFIYLGVRTSLIRIATNIYLGDGTEAPKSAGSDAPPVKKTGSLPPDTLLIASRAHANFVENVPLALLISTVVELNGGSRKVLSRALAVLLFFRVVHVELGLKRRSYDGTNYKGWGRPVGFYGTMAWIGGMSGYAAWLARSYWGF